MRGLEGAGPLSIMCTLCKKYAVRMSSEPQISHRLLRASVLPTHPCLGAQGSSPSCAMSRTQLAGWPCPGASGKLLYPGKRQDSRVLFTCPWSTFFPSLLAIFPIPTRRIKNKIPL